MLDESNKRNNDKGCAILLRMVNPESGLVQNRFLDMPICNKATGANLFAAVDESMHSVRKEDYKEFQSFTETPVEVIVKHICTRWLSLEKSVKIILSQWPALQSYFASVKESERPGRANRCMVAYTNVLVNLSYQFLSYALALLNRFNVIFQAEGCMILQLLDETKDLLRTYLSTFVKRDLLQRAEDILQVDYNNPDNQVSDVELDVGTAARRHV
ncbi:hypothetical protein LSAT2_003748, partial [Lamellibrachia satsuma]